jgi:hypothetical protein
VSVFATLSKVAGALFPGVGTAVASKALGAVNTASTVAIIGVLWQYRAESITFTYEQLAMFAGVLWWYVEANRRAPQPGAQ